MDWGVNVALGTVASVGAYPLGVNIYSPESSTFGIAEWVRWDRGLSLVRTP